MLSTVVSRVRRRLRRSHKSQEQPPDLRRWSDFMNPFPHVTAGGYRKYYAKHGLPNPKPLHTTPSDSSQQPLPPAQDASTSSSHVRVGSGSYTISGPIAFPSPTPYLPSSSTLPSRRRGKKDSGLSTIDETPATSLLLSNSPTSTTTHKRARAETISTTHSSSLKRKRRLEVLRTPSVERDWPHVPPTLDLFHNDYPSPTSSHQPSPHSSPTDTDTPPTTFEGLYDDSEDLACHVDAIPYAKARKRTEYEDIGPHERPESGISYYTARSNFSVMNG